MSLTDKLTSDLINAMKSGDKITVVAIRSIKASLKNAEINKGEALEENEMLAAVMTEAKKRKEAIEEYKKADRQELIDAELNELKVIEKYLPQQMTEDEISLKVDEVFNSVKPSSMKEIGKVMGPIMKELKGKADGRLVQNLVKKRFERIE